VNQIEFSKSELGQSLSVGESLFNNLWEKEYIDILITKSSILFKAHITLEAAWTPLLTFRTALSAWSLKSAVWALAFLDVPLVFWRNLTLFFKTKLKAVRLGFFSELGFDAVMATALFWR
jgi:hypothetical protein